MDFNGHARFKAGQRRSFKECRRGVIDIGFAGDLDEAGPDRLVLSGFA